MMVVTGLVLAFILWALVLITQSNSPQEPRITPQKPLETNKEEYRITPATIASVSQTGIRYSLTGHGVAGSGLIVFQGGETLGTTKINADGEWTLEFALATPFSAIEIHMRMATPDGNRVQSDQSLLVISAPFVPVARKTIAFDDIEVPQTSVLKTLILLSAPGANSRVLQTPFHHLPQENGFVIEAIDYDNSGGVIFSGQSSRQGQVRIYANSAPIGVSRVDKTGRWSLIFGSILPLGKYKISIELVSNNDQETIRLELPFERQAPILEADNIRNMRVEYFDDHIQIVRKLYGGGYQFTVIYAPLALDD
ncbi:MAG: hypothetical protein COA43_15180 [Robiginitomaculum sp.]|nr:MAG: hypothetical protein COA43_15180 [Robiginitomaculum sp.]